MPITILYVTFPDRKSAEVISNALLDKQVIACANLVPSRSIYLWKGIRETKREVVGLFKTTKEQAAKAQKIIEQLHPYEAPCIMQLPVTANKAYEDWVRKETGKKP